MNLINVDEKELLIKWAKENQDKKFTDTVFSKPATNNRSYWEEYEDSEEIIEYGFDNIPELKSLLQQNLSEDVFEQLILPLSIAIFKERRIIDVNDLRRENINCDLEIRESNGGLVLPHDVYVF